MIAAARFLRAFGDALALRQQSDARATQQRAADEACFARLRELLLDDPRPLFRFARGGLEYGALRPIDLEHWPWSARLAARGIERLEFTALPAPGTLAAFLDYAAGLLPDGGLAPRLTPDGLRWGLVFADASLTDDGYPLGEEFAVVRDIFRGVERGDGVRGGDAALVAVALDRGHGPGAGLTLPLLQVRNREEYQPAHALNTALLALAVGRELELSPADRHEAGLASLLHDIGMIRLPAETLAVDRFTPEDRAVLRGHPLEGARLLLRQGQSFESAAVVAYEHHLRSDGSGYPRLSYPREPHQLSRLVAVCDAFDALLAPRADRPGLDPASALRQLERSAVTQFDPAVVGALGEVVLRAAGQGTLALTTRAI